MTVHLGAVHTRCAARYRNPSCLGEMHVCQLESARALAPETGNTNFKNHPLFLVFKPLPGEVFLRRLFNKVSPSVIWSNILSLKHFFLFIKVGWKVDAFFIRKILNVIMQRWLLCDYSLRQCFRQVMTKKTKLCVLRLSMALSQEFPWTSCFQPPARLVNPTIE